MMQIIEDITDIMYGIYTHETKLKQIYDIDIFNSSLALE